MATRIIEFRNAYRTDNLPVVPPATAAQTPITASGTSQQSAAFSADCTVICVQSDEIVHVARGSSPTATTSHYKILAGGEQFFSVKPGDKLAVLLGA